MIKLTKIVSGYLPPEDGPFECENCHYFNKGGKCELVEGNIDPEGCCNLYTPKDSDKSDKSDDDESIDIDTDDEVDDDGD